MVKGNKRKGSEGYNGADDYDPSNNQLTIYGVRRDVLYKRMENILELAHKAETDPQQFRAFRTSALNIETMRNDYQKVLESYNLLNLQINPGSSVDYDSWDSFEEMYCYIKQILQDNESQNAVPLTSQSLVKSKPRLPPIDLMSFNGEVKNWPLFYQQFKTIIHDNASLTDSEKVYYLVGKLTGQASCVCAGLAPTAQNYNIIWDALVQKYDDPRSLASAYLNQLLRFKPLSTANSTGLDSFINNFNSSVEALKQLELTDLTDFIFLHLALQKLDSDTIKLFEITYRKEKIPSYKSLIEFIKEQSKVLSRSSTATINKPVDNSPHKNRSPVPSKSFVNTDAASGSSGSDKTDKCSLCRGKQHEHLYSCSSFMKLTPHERFNFIKLNAFCNNCLSVKHKTLSCTSKHLCSHCSSRHHSLLHFNVDVNKSHCNIGAVVSEPAINNISPAPASAHDLSRTASSGHDVTHNAPANVGPASAADKVDNRSPQLPADNASVCTVSCDRGNRLQTTTLLGTAKIKYIDSLNRTHYLRCLIDPGSQSDYVSADCCKRLSLPIRKQTRYSEVQGIGGASQKILGITALHVTSRFENNYDKYAYAVSPLVVERITSQLPDSRVDAAAIGFIHNLPLADDDFSQPGPIDMLLGVNMYCEILLFDKIKSPNTSMPSAFETTLGYLLMGDAPIISPPPQPAPRTLCAFTCDPLHQLVERFWATEELPSRTFLSPDDQKCEDIYISTTVRNPDGSYSVDLPFKDDPNKLGDSFITAKKRFLLLERKLYKDPELKSSYDEIIRDYLDKGILLPTAPEEACLSGGFFIPHHPIVRADKATTKVRPVLDGSAKTDTGLSLNDILHCGVNLQAYISHSFECPHV